MNESTDIKLDRLFKIEEDRPEAKTEIVKVNSNYDDRNLDKEEDYKESRERFYNLLDKGNDALANALEVAKDSDQPRAYEVVSMLLKTVTETNEKLIDLQLKMENLKQLGEPTPTSVTNNALFVGSTHELQKLLKGEKKDVNEHNSDGG